MHLPPPLLARGRLEDEPITFERNAIRLDMSERIFTGFLFLIFLILFSGNRQIPGLATGAVGHSLFYSRR